MRLYALPQGVARQKGDVLQISQHASLDGVVDNLTAVLSQAEVVAEVPLQSAIDNNAWAPLLNRCGQFIIAGLNYRAHCAEIGVAVPEKLVFGKAPGSAIHYSGGAVLMPAEAHTQVDYEGEIGLLIGKAADHVAVADAWDCIAGIMPLNDVSARDVQAGGTLEAVGQAKGFATFKPCGPWLFTPDEFADKNDIRLRTWVNDEQRQEGQSADMVFDLPTIVSVVSARIPLAPGDIICTGTPGGVAHGGAYPYLSPGDKVTIQLDDLPPLYNEFQLTA